MLRFINVFLARDNFVSPSVHIDYKQLLSLSGEKVGNPSIGVLFPSWLV
jgi:hypothetical protein